MSTETNQIGQKDSTERNRTSSWRDCKMEADCSLWIWFCDAMKIKIPYFNVINQAHSTFLTINSRNLHWILFLNLIVHWQFHFVFLRWEQLFVVLMSTLVTTKLSKQLVILLKTPAYLLQQTMMIDFHLAGVTLLFQVITVYNCQISNFVFNLSTQTQTLNLLTRWAPTNINRHILLTILYAYLVMLVGRISFPKWLFPLFLYPVCLIK